MGAINCTVSPASRTLCGTPPPQLLSMPICAVCWSEDPRFGGKACLQSPSSLGRAVQLDRPIWRGSAAGLASPALLRVRPAGHDRDRNIFMCGRLYRSAGGLRSGLAHAMTQQTGEARAQLPMVALLLPPQRHQPHRSARTRMLAESGLPVLNKPRPQWRMTPVSKALQWQRRRESQAGPQAPKLRPNMRRRFVVADLQAVRGKQILPVDHILTTGARAGAAARILLEPGAASVWVATPARVQRQLKELRDNVRNNGRFSHWGPTGDGPDADRLELRIESRIESSDRSSQHQPSF
jgi:hypothetical protein